MHLATAPTQATTNVRLPLRRADSESLGQVDVGRGRALRLVLPAATLLSVVAAALAAGTPASAQSDPPVRYRDIVFEQVDRQTDVVYGSAIDVPSGRTVELALDVYEPRGDTETARPALIFIHGGGFIAGDKSSGRPYCEQFARRGYFAVSIAYRLSQGNLVTVGIPAAVSDARQAVHWMRENAAKYRIDTSRIVIGGSSAGGITSLFVAYTEVEKETSGPSSEVAAVMDLWGSLYTYVNEVESGEPPVVIIHGTEDLVVPYRYAEELRDRLEEVGVPYAFYPLEGVGHGSPDSSGNAAKAAEFFFDQLWGQGPPPTQEPATPTSQATTPVPSPTASPVGTPAETPQATTEPGASDLYLPLLFRQWEPATAAR